MLNNKDENSVTFLDRRCASQMNQFAVAARTKCHRQCGLNNRHVFPHGSGVQWSQIKVLASWLPSEASLLDSWMAIFFWCICNVSFLYVPISTYRCILRNWGLGLQHMNFGRAQFSSQAKQRNDIFEMVNDNENFYSIIIKPVKMSFKNKGRIRTFHTKLKLREFIGPQKVL